MNAIRRWYFENQIQITWFIIGWLAMCLLVDFGRGDWLGAAIDIFLIAINYSFVRK